jgi:hypothetical protein
MRLLVEVGQSCNFLLSRGGRRLLALKIGPRRHVLLAVLLMRTRTDEGRANRASLRVLIKDGGERAHL